MKEVSDLPGYTQHCSPRSREGRRQGARHFTQEVEKPSLTPDHITTLGMVMCVCCVQLVYLCLTIQKRLTIQYLTIHNKNYFNSVTPLSYQYRRCENIELIHTNWGKPEIIHNVDTTRCVATFGWYTIDGL